MYNFIYSYFYSYFVTISDDSYVGFYPLTGCTGARDYSDYENDGAVSGVDYVSGPQGDINSAAHFEANLNSQVSVASASILDTQYSLTLLLQVQVDTAGTVFHFGTKPGLGLSIIDEETLKIQFSTKGRELNQTYEPALAPITRATWVYIAATYDYQSGIGALYLDRSQKATFQMAVNTEILTSKDIFIGGDGFSGNIACVRIYDRVLSSTEISDQTNCPTGKCAMF